VSTLQDYNNTNNIDGGFFGLYSSGWNGRWLQASQTFTASGYYEITSVKVLVSRDSEGSSLGNFKLAIQSVDENGRPSGEEIVSDILDFTSLPISPSTWVEFEFFSNPTLSRGTKYAIVMSADGDPIFAQHRWATWDRSTDGYPDGSSFVAADTSLPQDPSGDDWEDRALDMIFEVYGITAEGFTPFPTSRPDDYVPDDVWDPKADDGEGGKGAWTDLPWDLVTLGGGRYNQQIVVLGHRKIYFQELE